MDGNNVLVMCWAVFTTLCKGLRQDTVYGAPVEVAEYPGVHVEPPQPAKEKEPLSCHLCDGVVVNPDQVLFDRDPEEL